jgi:hypothetical protein
MADLVRSHKAQQEDIFIHQKKPLIGQHNKKRLKAIRNKAVVVEQQIVILRTETSMQSKDAECWDIPIWRTKEEII